VPSSSALSRPEVQALLVADVMEKMRPLQADMLEGVDENTRPLDIAAVVAKTTQLIIAQSIDIPRIAVVPSGEVTTGFHPFKLDLNRLHLQPGKRELVAHNLHTNEQTRMAMEGERQENRLEDYIVHAMIDFDDIDYPTHAELLYDLAGQAVAHFQSYLSEAETHDVLNHNRRLIANDIHSQMMAHFWEQASHYEVKVNRGFTELRPCNVTASADQPIRPIRETLEQPGRIKQMLFGGFARCLYQYQKFDSDTERRFAIILERDSLKWLKPAKGQFQIFYKMGANQPEYIPDFIAETSTCTLMIETKARLDIDSQEVQAKAAAATRWCKNASEYALSVGNKPWRYILLPHDEVNESRHLNDYLRFEIKPS
jgi:type III restriction enzyme